jgi:hypothetical protein
MTFALAGIVLLAAAGRADDMNADTDGSRRCQAGLRRLVVVAVVTGAAVLAAACSGGSHTTASTAGSGQLTAPNLAAFAQCIRSHGVPNFYFSKANPSSPDTMFGYAIPSDINAFSPQFQAAMTACRHLVGGPSGPPPGPTPAQLRGLVRAAACVRAHGYPTFPDPKVQNSVIFFPPLSGIDPNSAQFQATLRACHEGSGSYSPGYQSG